MKVVLGTMTFGGQTAASEAVEMLEVFAGHCQHKNVLELDTARLYQEGRTEDLLGSLGLSQEVQEVVSISSKANPFADSLSAERTKTQCLTSLSSLRVPQLDIFYLHGPDSSINIEETLAAVQELFEAGKFRRFGLSNFAAWEVGQISSFVPLRLFTQAECIYFTKHSCRLHGKLLLQPHIIINRPWIMLMGGSFLS